VWKDTETTGLDEEKHAIIQSAAVLTDLNFKVLGYWQSLVKPFDGAEITDRALDINKRTRDEIMNAPSELEVAKSFITFCRLVPEKPRIAGYFVQYDMKMWAALLARCGVTVYPWVVPWLDSLEIAKKKYPNLPKRKCDDPTCPKCLKGQDHTHRLVDIAHHLNLPINAHDAMGDLKATITSTAIMLDGRIAPLATE
jgi:DNA polymerase III epsilon subunit-like protein